MTERRYRRVRAEVSAIKWEGGKDNVPALEDFCGEAFWDRAQFRNVPWTDIHDAEQIVVFNVRMKQWLCVPVGHWIVRGTAGELEPVAPDVFAKTYEPVTS